MKDAEWNIPVRHFNRRAATGCASKLLCLIRGTSGSNTPFLHRRIPTIAEHHVRRRGGRGQSPASARTLSVGGRYDSGETDELLRILRFAIDEYLIVHMGAGTAAAAAEKTDLLMLGDPLSDRDDVAVKVAIDGGDTVSVIDLDQLAVVAAIAGIGHGPPRRGMNRGHIGRRQVDPRMKGRPPIERIVPGAESALELVIIERHRQWERSDQAPELFHLVRGHSVRLVALWRHHKGTASPALLAQHRKQAVDIKPGRGEQAPSFGDGLASELRNAPRLVFGCRRRIRYQRLGPGLIGCQLSGLCLDQLCHAEKARPFLPRRGIELRMLLFEFGDSRPQSVSLG